MEPIHPDEMVPDTKYSMEDSSVHVKFMERMEICNVEYKNINIIYKTVTFKRVAYRLDGVWHYLFHVDGRKRYFTSANTFYPYVE